MKNFKILWLSMIALSVISCDSDQKNETKYETKSAESGGYSYEFVENDPLKTRIYTLDNGLKVYLSDYKNEPKIQTYIAVDAGGKNDPAETTGLAHYLEHMMFKGTDVFGTVNWEKEKVLLDSIEQMFEHYRTLTDPKERKSYYNKIDQVSNEASKYAIPSEYDKMISAIGASGTNAYTSNDETVYVNNIPSNQLENFLKIEGRRFKKIVNRLFHTELEAVYEEKNRALDNDFRKSYEAMLTSMFTKHQYGTQLNIGTIDHLKNPSITKIVNFFNTYYVPNNVAICMSGDLDYDQTIKLIDEYFGDWEPNENLKQWKIIQEDEIQEPIVAEVVGPDAESVSIGYRFDGRGSEDYKYTTLIDYILNNSEVGLMDLNLKQKQKVLSASSRVQNFNDYAVHNLSGTPRDGQTLEEVSELLRSQIEKIKKGDFEDWLIDAVINNFKKSQIQGSESNRARANAFVVAFTNDINWIDYVTEIDDMRKITKEDLVRYANEHYKDNYVVVYKRNGKVENVQKVEKPEITKIVLNRDIKSPFHEELLATKVVPLKPSYVDYNKDIQKAKMDKDIEILYTKNNENDLFNLYYLSNVGSNNDPRKQIAVEYLDYLGTEEYTSEELKKELYKLGCNYFVFTGEDRTFVGLSGLTENMEKAMQLFEGLLANPKADQEALDKMIDGILKEREDTKKNKNAILFGGLMNYGVYGANSPFTNVLSNKELGDLQPEELIEIIKDFKNTDHRVMYYGPKTKKELISSLNQYHALPNQLSKAEDPVVFEKQKVNESTVYWADYDMVQAEIMMTTQGEKYDKSIIPVARLYNQYFGSGLSSVVFQEIREAQGLAYSVFASYNVPSKTTENDSYLAYVGTQADKQEESMNAMIEIINKMPESETGLNAAKKSILSQLESQRITKTALLFSYLNAEERGLDYDIRKDIYEEVKNMELTDVKAFQQKYVKAKNYNFMVLGNREKLDFKALSKYGKVKKLSLEELFGYEEVRRIKKD